MEDSTDAEKFKKLQRLKSMLHDVEGKLQSLLEKFGWDCSKLIERAKPDLVTCSINSQHKVSENKIKLHQEKCYLNSQGYNESDKIFPEYSGSGSCISFTPELINSVTKNISSEIGHNSLRSVPQTSASFDQNFNREEKLALYDYVIANTKKQQTYPDFCGQTKEKKEEKKEMTIWEIAAAERDAKRRRASYRNKVHTSGKTHTQTLKEVIEAQMEMLKGEDDKNDELNVESKIHNSESHFLEDKRKSHKLPNCREERENNKRKHYSNHYSSSSYSGKRSRRDSKGDTGSRSRSCDKYRKWKTGERRSHFHKSRHPLESSRE